MRTPQTKSAAATENQKPAANGASNDAPRLLFNINESASRLSMSAVSVRKLIRQRRIQRLADFRKILIPASELERFANAAQ
jgi:hypothetical protein